MKKGKKIAIVVVLIVLAIIYFGVKGFLLWSVSNRMSSESIEIKEAFANKDTIIIKSTNHKEEDYFSYEELKIRNDFEIFDKEHNVYTIKNTDIKVVFNKTPIDDLVTYVKEEVKNMGMYYDLTKDLEKNNIDTDFKLYEYLLDNLEPKLNLFSSINKFRKFHAVDLALTLIMSSCNKLTLIDGDYEGYISQYNGQKRVVIYHKNDSYSMNIYSGRVDIYNDEYSDEKLYDLLSTIIFD